MKGPEVFQFAVKTVPQSIRATLDAGKTNWYGVDFEAAIPYLVDRLR